MAEAANARADSAASASGAIDTDTAATLLQSRVRGTTERRSVQTKLNEREVMLTQGQAADVIVETAEQLKAAITKAVHSQSEAILMDVLQKLGVGGDEACDDKVITMTVAQVTAAIVHTEETLLKAALGSTADVAEGLMAQVMHHAAGAASAESAPKDSPAPPAEQAPLDGSGVYVVTLTRSLQH